MRETSEAGREKRTRERASTRVGASAREKCVSERERERVSE